MLFIAIFVGAVLAYATEDAFPGLAGALIAWLAVRSWRQQRRIDELSRVLGPAAAAAPSAAPPTGAEPRDDGRAVPAAAATVPTATVPAPTVAAAPPGPGADALWDDADPVAPAAASTAAALPRGAAWLTTLRGWLFGGNTIVKAGIGILFVGLAFLVKYASEHVSLPIELRLAGVGAVAVALLVVGWRLRDARAGYAQVLQGGAVAVMYLTLFAAFRFYGVLGAGAVFALMVVVAALAAALAVLQDARALALVGALGGYATPLLISTGEGNHVALFSYYGVLSLGIAAVAWFKDWRALNLVGFFATFLVGTVWGVLKYDASHYASSQAFLIANFLLFNLIGLLPSRRAAAGPPARGAAWVNGTLMFGLPTVVFVLQHGLVRHTEYGTAISALVLAAFYVLLARWMRGRGVMAVSFEASLAIAVVFLTLVIPFALDARSTAGAWALEGAGLAWLGWRQQRGRVRAFGYALLLLSGAAMASAQAHQGAPASVFNATLFNALMAAAASLVAAYFAHRGQAASGQAARATLAGRAEALAEPALIGWGVLWLLAAAAWQIDAFVAPRLTLVAWLVAGSAIALLLAALGVRLAWRGVALPALAHAPGLLLAAVFSAVLLLEPAAHGGAWAWPVALASHLAMLRWAAPRWPARPGAWVHTLGVLVLATLLALQGRAGTAGWGDAASAWSWLGWLAGPAVLLVLLLWPGLRQLWPVRDEPRAYTMGASALLAAGLLAWTVLANIASNGSARPLPYLPLLNPLDVGVGVALAAAATWLHGDAAQALLGARRRWGVALLGAGGFVWLNAMLIRGFHHHGGVPFRAEAWLDSLAVQTGLALLWSALALALMWFATRRALRAPWLLGAVLLGAVVLKLLLVDLSGSGTVTRIISFIGVGVLMLVIGYVAPLPANKQEGSHAAQ